MLEFENEKRDYQSSGTSNGTGKGIYILPSKVYLILSVLISGLLIPGGIHYYPSSATSMSSDLSLNSNGTIESIPRFTFTYLSPAIALSSKKVIGKSPFSGHTFPSSHGFLTLGCRTILFLS